MATATQQANPQELNLQARSFVLAKALERKQSIFSTNFGSVNPRGSDIVVPVRNVGLIKSFLVEIEFDLVQAAAETLTRTPWGPANILSQVVLNDFSNNTRINTPGWHLHALATARRQAPFGAAYTTDSQPQFGSVVEVTSAPASVTTSEKIRWFYEIPVSYSDFDLRGAMYANVVNATAQLQLTVNPNLVQSSTASGVLAAYKSSTADRGTITNFKVNVYQIYLDQIPMVNGQPILPALDISTVYELKNTALTGIAAGQDNPIPYSNFREFMSTVVIYDQNGTVNPGDDINYFALESANYTNVFKVDPYAQALATRNLIGDDFPTGSYYFDHRRRPINTMQYGNMQLLVNPISAAAQTQMLVGFESLAVTNMVTQAGSLPAASA